MSDTDRSGLTDHPLAQVLKQPLPPAFKVTRYRLVESLVADLGIYFNAFWLKIRTGERLGLLRIPPTYVDVYGGLVPTRYEINIGVRRRVIAPVTRLHFRGVGR